MQTSSNRELARQLGVSEAAVRKAERAGRIRRTAEGAWEVEQVRGHWQQQTDPAQQRPRAAAGATIGEAASAATTTGTTAAAGIPTRLRPVPQAAVSAVAETLSDAGLPAPSPAGGTTFLQARTANEVLKAQERRVKLQRLKGELIDRQRATAQVFRLGREERDAWLNWPARVAAVMAAELGVDPHRLHTVLEQQVRQHLGELADLRIGFG